MSTGYQISEQEELHYVTFQIIRWIDIFTRRIYRDIVIDSLRFCQQNKGLEVYVGRAEDYLYSSARNYAGLDGVLDVIVSPRAIERIGLMRSIK